MMKVIILLAVVTTLVTLAQGQGLNQSYRSQPFAGFVPQTQRQARTKTINGVTYIIRPETTLVLPTIPVQSLPPTLAAPSPKRECPTGTCQQYTNCVRATSSPNRFCLLENGFTGICCADEGAKRYYPDNAAQEPGQIYVNLDEVKQVIQGWDRLEDQLESNKIFVRRGTTGFSHNSFFGGSEVSLSEAKGALEALLAFVSFSKGRKLSSSAISSSNFDIRKTNLAQTCGPQPRCDANAVYRTADGTCNNLLKTAQGKAVSNFARLLAPVYFDGISEPKRAFDGTELANARLISLSISPDAALENNKYSLLLMQFGQFVDHDLTRSAVTQTHTGASINCCDQKIQTNRALKHPACFSISVPPQDSFLLSERQSCIDFVRSAPAINPRCRFGPREQLNQLSAYLDGNNIYGSSKKEADDLREFRNGRLRVSLIGDEQFLPLNPNDTSCALPKESQLKCFKAGDGRANEVLDLTVLHTVWMREHNRVAAVLKKLNPNWNDETLYQEAKRVVVAEFQHIIYNEFLPLIVGQRAWNHFGLALADGFVDTYNPNIDATILNEFATAGYRLHSLVAGSINLINHNRNQGNLLLRNQFNNPEVLYHLGGYEMRLESLTSQAIQSFDNFVTKELTNHLFQVPGKRFGLDLVALNIQRGRDHGIPGYVRYRELCGLSRVTSFDDLTRIFSNPQVPAVMAQLYRSVEDIDLFIGGTSEKPMPGAVVGPTFACIIGEQFRRTKEGDRFWYENAGQTGQFTPEQLAQIKKATMARVLCDNSAIEVMQPGAFLMPNKNNPKLSCNDGYIPWVNLKPWKAGGYNKK